MLLFVWESFDSFNGLYFHSLFRGFIIYPIFLIFIVFYVLSFPVFPFFSSLCPVPKEGGDMGT